MTPLKGANKQVALKPYCIKDLCHLYGVSRSTINNWLKPFEKEIGKKIGYYYTIAQVKIIFEKLDLPAIITGDE